MTISNPPAPPGLEKFAELISVVSARLWDEVLYELQTGGGMSFENVPRCSEKDSQTPQMKKIRATLDRLKGISDSGPERVAARLSHPNLRVLDVGAGKAPWSLAIASRYPSVFVTAIDLPEQMTTLRDAVSKSGISKQFRLAAVDVFRAAWQADDAYDLVLLANVCHLFDEARNRQLLRQVALCLRPAGALAIIDQVLDEQPDWVRWGALYAVGALHRAPGGRLFPGRIYSTWLEELGFCNIAEHGVCPLPPLTLIQACKTA